MRSTISLVIAEIMVKDIERQIINQNNNFVFWYHCVGDIRTCVPHSKLNESLVNINYINQNIKFTSEI